MKSVSPLLRLRRRASSLVTRQLARALDAVGVPFNPYLAVGVPLRAAEIPGRPVAAPVAAAATCAPRESRPSGVDLDRPPLRQELRPRPAAAPTLELFVVPSGLADYKGLVLTSDGRLVNPAALDQARHLGDWQHQVHRRRPTPIDGALGMFAHAYDGNLFHWYFELLPKLALLDASGVEPDRLYLSQRHRFQRESLELFGLAAERVVASERTPVVRAERLLAISHWDAFRAIPAWACDFLRARARIPDGLPTAERIYVSRADAVGRRVVNEDEVVARLARFGFRRVVLSEHSLAEQAALFRGASVVVGPHGAGLSHAVFCRPGARLVELAPPRYHFGCWRDLAAKCGLDFRLVPAVGSDAETDHGWRHQRENFAVDVEALDTVLERGLG